VRLSVITGIVAVLAATSPSGTPRHNSSIDRLPRVFVWAWERPEDLRDLETGIGVAFLAQTIIVAGDQFRVAPRRQPLRVDPATSLIAVTRIEAGERWAPDSGPPTAALASAIAATAHLRRVSAIQLDFDAVASERVFYRQLIGQLRQRVPAALPISITALASWCAGDQWLGGLPIDEAVPMLFRMGPGNEPFRRIAMSRVSAAPACRGAVGTSLDEPIDSRADGRRVYVFNPRPWNRLSLLQVGRTIR
jgi:hypothetical protein